MLHDIYIYIYKQTSAETQEVEGDVAAATGRGSSCCVHELSCGVCNYSYWKVHRDLAALEKENGKKRLKKKEKKKLVEFLTPSFTS